jgi:acyl transferase domain-containing protein/NAD(P)H-dependent flavin oxidoreductase YrpB (nitropropane dioxygenase family)
MRSIQPRRDADLPHNLVLGVSPCGVASAALTTAVSGAGGLGVLDLGTGDRAARDELARALRLSPSTSIGIRVSGACRLTCDDVVELLGDEAGRVEAVVLDWDAPWQIDEIPDRHLVLVEVATWQEAVWAAERGVDGVIARGSEAGGRVSELGSFVLLQQLMAQPRLTVPVWVCGGIGPQTAAAAVVGGAAGVVLDTQLALLPEAELPDEHAAVIAASDGTNSALVDGHRVLPGGLPAGLDANLASEFAERYGSATKAVRAVLGAIADTADADARPLITEGAALAQRLGTRLPVAQGPMTRVSDQAGFAAAVAEGGALPFVALALSTAEQTSKLLEQTRVELGERPWGVGVLGFAKEEVRSAQIEVIRQVRPTHALIAGGRPDQARVLEDAGISTFLHVPSPGLLAQFLEAGARKFVFEGAECGGHVGPRTSFSLWQAQLNVLADWAARRGGPPANGGVAGGGGKADELQLLFAGGVHDARSSAMVSALAAPLARSGAAVGILMGTGYLFTAEAVSRGAIGPVFQQQVVDALGTELLETAPGHATRCVVSPFTESFRSTAEGLQAEGVDQREVWERLEQLNVGRLRIASKGLQRVDAELVAVGENEQLELGLFMAGQVAALRSEVTTIARLHDDVSTGADEAWSERAGRLRHELGRRADAEVHGPLDVAVVGMSCVYPGADDLAQFWSNILANVDSVTEVPHERWDPELYYAGPGEKSTPPRGDWTPSKWGGFVNDIGFDPLRYGIPPSALAAIEPVQLIALQVADQALADAGYAAGGYDKASTGVIFAGAVGSDLANAKTLRMVLPSYLGKLPEGFEEQLPLLSEDSLPGRLGSVIAGRIANRLDLGGMNYTIDAACASSLAAVDAACKELTSGTSDLMLCGGADLHNALEDFLLFASVGALSPSGRCKTFDSSADGIALSEGVSCVVLKRLADAERDGDRIYAVIKGVGGGSDGKALGLTAPRPEGQRRALERAYRMAGVSPADVGLVEAHGTGTVVGDRTELQTLSTMFVEAGARPGSCTLGSVKSQIGHTKCAAGLAGMIKVALALHHGVQPPTLHLGDPNPGWQPGESPFVFRREPSPWLTRPEQRFAGVSAFGFGGTNFHVVLAGHASAAVHRHAVDQWPAELFTFHGADHQAASRPIQRLVSLIETNTAHGHPWRLRDLALTAAGYAARADTPVQVAVVARTVAELDELLKGALAGESDPGRGLFRAEVGVDSTAAAKLAVLFPGQGSQRPGMLAELFAAFPELHRVADPDDPVLAAMFPPAAYGADAVREQEQRLRDTRMAQPALGVAGLAAHRLLSRLGIEADMYAGHSYGELVALAAAGVYDARTLRVLSAARAGAILDSAGHDPGSMAAVAATADDVQQVLDDAGFDGRVVVANHNGPRQVVISGASDAVADAVERLAAAGHAAKALPVACAFHSPVIEGAGELFAKELVHHRFAAPERPVWTNRLASSYPVDEPGIAAELARQVVSPVRFTSQIEGMYAAGARTFLEAGPGRVLSGLVSKILGDRPHTVVALESGGQQGIPGLLTALARLAVAGVRVRTGWLFAGRDARDVSTLTPPPAPGWTVNGQFVRTKDGQPVPGGLLPARQIEDLTVNQQPPASDRDALVSDFLRSSRELIAAQRDVLLSYLGTAPPVAPVAPVQLSAPVVEPMRPSSNHVERTTHSDSNSQPVELEPVVQQPEPEPERQGVDVLTTVIGVIAQRTGYPVEMITPDLDLEADLSVDSIKRTEIAGELVSKLGLADQADRIEHLTKARTAGAMATVLQPTEPSGASAPQERASAPQERASAVQEHASAVQEHVSAVQEHEPAAAAAAEPAPVRAEAPGRYVLQLADEPATVTAEPTALVGANIVVAGGGRELAEAVAGQLAARGAMPFVVSGAPELGPALAQVDGLISLHALEPGGDPVLPAAYPIFRSAVQRQAKVIFAAAPAGELVDQRAVGLRGFFRTLQRELPDTHLRLLELEPEPGPDAVAATLVDELFTRSEQPVVVVDRSGRRAFQLVRAELGGLADTGAGPAGVGAAEAAAMGIGADSVVLLVGGARGITAQFARTLATASRCRIELAGRTALATAPEPPEVASAGNLRELRGALARSGQLNPAEIDRQAREILAQREVAATLGELRAAGSEVGYHTVDARDPESIRHLVKEIHAEHGRLDGVVYAAGVIDDHLVVDKDPDAFAAVYNTKVDGARALLAELSELPAGPKFVVLFGSIAAALGNRGQADYAAANDALEAISAHAPGRVTTVHWGPWAPADLHGGMVSPELSRSYAERGIALIDPADGVASLLRELAWGRSSSVIYTASGW